MSPSARRRAAVVYNPTKVDPAKLRAAVGKAEAAAGWEPTLWLETSEDDPGGGQARQAIGDEVEVVLAAGGDGTVRAVAEALRGSTVALALLPAGTGNVLARNLELSLTKLDESVLTAFTGTDRQIDVGMVRVTRAGGAEEEYAFVVMAGIGLDAKMIANTRPRLKKRVGWLAYVDAIARSVRDSDKVRMHYRVDGGALRTMRAHTIMVGNCGSLPGNVLLLPDAEVDDGVFDVVTLRPEGFGGWVQIWVKIVWENGVLRRSSVGRKLMGLSREVRTLRYLKAATIDVQLDRAEEFELDGDEFGTVIGFNARIDPLALRVRVPAPTRAEERRAASAAGVVQPTGAGGVGGSDERMPRSQSRASMKTSSS